MPVHIGPETQFIDRDGMASPDEWMTLHAGLNVLGDIIGQTLTYYENRSEHFEIWEFPPKDQDDAFYGRRCIISGKMFPASHVIMTPAGPVGDTYYKPEVQPSELMGFMTDSEQRGEPTQ